MSVTLTLADDIDISRGDMIVQENNIPKESSTIEIMLCWMNLRPLQVNGKYAVKHTNRDVRCVVRKINYILNINTLEKQEEVTTVKLNDIACVELQTTKPLFYDSYSMNRITGSLILIDESTNETMGAGMIL
jgi:sulfate adenylyltransferase subunit 1